MTKHIHTNNSIANSDAPSNCWAWLAIIQIALGILLVTSSVYGYALLHHSAVMIPAVMGSFLLFGGIKAFTVCRNSRKNRRHIIQTTR